MKYKFYLRKKSYYGCSNVSHYVWHIINSLSERENYDQLAIVSYSRKIPLWHIF